LFYGHELAITGKNSAVCCGGMLSRFSYSYSMLLRDILDIG
jgi:hypothetical protein